MVTPKFRPQGNPVKIKEPLKDSTTFVELQEIVKKEVSERRTDGSRGSGKEAIMD